MSENKRDNRRKKTKAVVGFAFALSLMASQAYSVSAAAETAGSIDELLGVDPVNTDSASNIGDGVLGAAANYSVFVKNNVSISGADCPGNMAVGGNVSVPAGGILVYVK